MFRKSLTAIEECLSAFRCKIDIQDPSESGEHLSVIYSDVSDIQSLSHSLNELGLKESSSMMASFIENGIYSFSADFSLRNHSSLLALFGSLKVHFLLWSDANETHLDDMFSLAKLSLEYLPRGEAVEEWTEAKQALPFLVDQLPILPLRHQECLFKLLLSLAAHPLIRQLLFDLAIERYQFFYSTLLKGFGSFAHLPVVFLDIIPLKASSHQVHLFIHYGFSLFEMMKGNPSIQDNICRRILQIWWNQLNLILNNSDEFIQLEDVYFIESMFQELVPPIDRFIDQFIPEDIGPALRIPVVYTLIFSYYDIIPLMTHNLFKSESLVHFLSDILEKCFSQCASSQDNPSQARLFRFLPRFLSYVWNRVLFLKDKIATFPPVLATFRRTCLSYSTDYWRRLFLSVCHPLVVKLQEESRFWVRNGTIFHKIVFRLPLRVASPATQIKRFTMSYAFIYDIQLLQAIGQILQELDSRSDLEKLLEDAFQLNAVLEKERVEPNEQIYIGLFLRFLVTFSTEIPRTLSHEQLVERLVVNFLVMSKMPFLDLSKRVFNSLFHYPSFSSIQNSVRNTLDTITVRNSQKSIAKPFVPEILPEFCKLYDIFSLETWNLLKREETISFMSTRKPFLESINLPLAEARSDYLGIQSCLSSSSFFDRLRTIILKEAFSKDSGIQTSIAWIVIRNYGIHDGNEQSGFSVPSFLLDWIVRTEDESLRSVLRSFTPTMEREKLIPELSTGKRSRVISSAFARMARKQKVIETSSEFQALSSSSGNNGGISSTVDSSVCFPHSISTPSSVTPNASSLSTFSQIAEIQKSSVCTICHLEADPLSASSTFAALPVLIFPSHYESARPSSIFTFCGHMFHFNCFTKTTNPFVDCLQKISQFDPLSRRYFFCHICKSIFNEMISLPVVSSWPLDFCAVPLAEIVIQRRIGAESWQFPMPHFSSRHSSFFGRMTASRLLSTIVHTLYSILDIGSSFTLMPSLTALLANAHEYLTTLKTSFSPIDELTEDAHVENLLVSLFSSGTPDAYKGSVLRFLLIDLCSQHQDSSRAGSLHQFEVGTLPLQLAPLGEFFFKLGKAVPTHLDLTPFHIASILSHAFSSSAEWHPQSFAEYWDYFHLESYLRNSDVVSFVRAAIPEQFICCRSTIHPLFKLKPTYREMGALFAAYVAHPRICLSCKDFVRNFSLCLICGRIVPSTSLCSLCGQRQGGVSSSLPPPHSSNHHNVCISFRYSDNTIVLSYGYFHMIACRPYVNGDGDTDPEADLIKELRLDFSCFQELQRLYFSHTIPRELTRKFNTASSSHEGFHTSSPVSQSGVWFGVI